MSQNREDLRARLRAARAGIEQRRTAPQPEEGPGGLSRALSGARRVANQAVDVAGRGLMAGARGLVRTAPGGDTPIRRVVESQLHVGPERREQELDEALEGFTGDQLSEGAGTIAAARLTGDVIREGAYTAPSAVVGGGLAKALQLAGRGGRALMGARRAQQVTDAAIRSPRTAAAAEGAVKGAAEFAGFGVARESIEHGDVVEGAKMVPDYLLPEVPLSGRHSVRAPLFLIPGAAGAARADRALRRGQAPPASPEMAVRIAELENQGAKVITDPATGRHLVETRHPQTGVVTREPLEVAEEALRGGANVPGLREAIEPQIDELSRNLPAVTRQVPTSGVARPAPVAPRAQQPRGLLPPSRELPVGAEGQGGVLLRGRGTTDPRRGQPYDAGIAEMLGKQIDQGTPGARGGRVILDSELPILRRKVADEATSRGGLILGQSGFARVGVSDKAIAKAGRLARMAGGVERQPNPRVLEIANKYTSAKNLPEVKPLEFSYDPALHQKIAKAYDDLPRYDASAREAYEAFQNETFEQFKQLEDSGIKVEFVEADPYKNSVEMMDDVAQNGRLKVFAGGEPTPQMAMKAENGISYNNMFRAVHDFFGHAGHGHTFGKIGEEGAWQAHSRMYSPVAQRAMTTETRGQNSWFNWSDANRGKAIGDRKFAEQKFAILPDFALPESARQTKLGLGQGSLGIRRLRDRRGFAEVSEPEAVVSGSVAETGKRAGATRERAVLEHYSDQPRELISPEFAGSGPVRGAERARGGPGKTYFYREGAKPEPGLGTHKHTVEGDFSFYDLAKDPEGLIDSHRNKYGVLEPESFDAIENAIKDAGYDGYFSSTNYPDVVAAFGEHRPTSVIRNERGFQTVEGPAPKTEKAVKVISREAGARQVTEQRAQRAVQSVTDQTSGSGPVNNGLVRRNMVEFSEWVKGLGEGGQKIGDAIMRMDRPTQARMNTNILDTEALLKSVPRQSRENVTRALHGREVALSTEEQAIVNQFRGILNRDLDDVTTAGLEAGAEAKAAKGGFAAPQVPNRVGRKIIERAGLKGSGDPKVAAAVERMVREGRAEDAASAYRQLRHLYDQHVRGVNGYFEKTRTILPEEWVELDPLKWHEGHFARTSRTVEYIKEFGPKDELANEALLKIRDQAGPVAEGQVRRYMSSIFQGVPMVEGGSRRLAQGISQYQTLSKLGASVLAGIKNYGQGFVNPAILPIRAQLRVLKSHPPFAHRWIKGSQKAADDLARGGVISTRGGSLTGDIAHRSNQAVLKPFTHPETQNQVRTALVAKHALQLDLETMAKYPGTDKAGQKLANFLKTLATNPGEAAARRLNRMGLSDDVLREVVETGRELTAQEILEAQFRTVKDLQHPLTPATMRRWQPHEWVKVAAKFKHFQLSQAGLIYDQVLKELFKGNAAPAVKFFAVAELYGELISFVNSVVLDKDRGFIMGDPTDRGLKGIGAAFAENIANAGGLALLYDLMWGIESQISGPAGSSAANVGTAAVDLIQRPTPTQAGAVLENLVRREIPAVRQLEAQINRVDKALFHRHRRSLENMRAREFARRYRTDKEAPGVAGGLKGVVVKAISGLPDFERTDRTLMYSYASQQIDAGDIEDASEYLAEFMRDWKPSERTEKLAGVKSSRNRTSPLGAIPKAERQKALSVLSSDERRRFEALQARYNRDYDRAIVRARKKAGW